MIRVILPAGALLVLITGAVLYLVFDVDTIGLFVTFVGIVAVIVTTLALSIGRVYDRVPHDKTYEA